MAEATLANDAHKNLRMPAVMAERLERAGQESGRPVAEIIREAIEGWLEEHER